MITLYMLSNGVKLVGVEKGERDGDKIRLMDAVILELIVTPQGTGFMPVVLGDTIVTCANISAKTYLKKNHSLSVTYLQAISGISSPPSSIIQPH